ncbi:MAG: peptide ABC transporter ATP-binding protein [Planctomycetes bacterium]|nr:peptide ABC transporter ATP-binding protein [Planctomycetota bacterium]
MPLLSVKDLAVRFETHDGIVRAVDGVSFEMEEGETLGLVGESGSGKSVTNLALLGLIPSPPGVMSGVVNFDGQEITKLPEPDLRKIRGNRIAMIFQDPMTSLNPLLTIGRQLTEVLELHKGMGYSQALRQSAAALGEVGLAEPEKRLAQYPHELSGGMRQRVMIAMGLLCEPRLLLADEPTTALDVTIQAQILELMAAVQKQHGTAIILVTHDLGVVAGSADRVAVMYAGRIVEEGPTQDIFNSPVHPYTKGLLSSVPRLDSDTSCELSSIPGSPPDLAEMPPGCAFAPRCKKVQKECLLTQPDLVSSGSPQRRHACPIASLPASREANS